MFQSNQQKGHIIRDKDRHEPNGKYLPERTNILFGPRLTKFLSGPCSFQFLRSVPRISLENRGDAKFQRVSFKSAERTQLGNLYRILSKWLSGPCPFARGPVMISFRSVPFSISLVRTLLKIWLTLNYNVHHSNWRKGHIIRRKVRYDPNEK